MTVLIIADDGEFSRNIVGRWQMERSVPEFAVVGSSVWQGSAGEFDLAIVAPMPASTLLPLVKQLEATTAAVLAVVNDAATSQKLREDFPRVLTLRQYEGWLDALVVLAGEALRRVEAASRARRAEDAAAAANRHATLGRYMIDMRHSMNNALTSVLGNAELLLLEPGGLSGEVREQIDTIRSMALRMHEVLQRFSSLDTEMQCAEKQSHGETKSRARASVAGS